MSVQKVCELSGSQPTVRVRGRHQRRSTQSSSLASSTSSAKIWKRWWNASANRWAMKRRILRRSFWVHGSYGTGKSYAAIFVKHLLEEPPETINAFMANHQVLSRYRSRFMKCRQNGDYLVIWKTGVYRHPFRRYDAVGSGKGCTPKR